MPPSLIDPRPLTRHQLDTLRVMLEEQRAFRTEQLAALYRPEPAGLLGSDDAEIHERLATGARTALREVQAALWRMDEGTYARCTACAGWVQPARLEILPQAATCLACQRVGATWR